MIRVIPASEPEPRQQTPSDNGIAGHAGNDKLNTVES